jgi:hypothetical protein
LSGKKMPARLWSFAEHGFQAVEEILETNPGNARTNRGGALKTEGVPGVVKIQLAWLGPSLVGEALIIQA